jgi:ABC-type transport system involved in multi-copper enzyme maturation permease subunit
MSTADGISGGKRQTTSFSVAAFRIFDLSLGQMLWSKRTIFLALVVGAPVAIAVLFRVLQAMNIGAARIGAREIEGPTIFGLFIWVLYLRFIVPVLGVFYGTSLIADEVEDKTITYLFARPIPRGAVLIGKYLAYLVATALVVLPSVMIVYFLVVPIGKGAVVSTFPDLLGDLGLLAVGLAAYGSLFAWIGAQFRYPLVLGLVFAFGWEQAAMLIPGYLRKFTIAYYLQGLVPHAMPQDSVLSFLRGLFRDSPSIPSCLLWLTVIWVGFLILAALTVEKREYILEQ